MNIDTEITAYIDCALWSSTDETDESGGNPLDSGDFELSDDARSAMAEDVRAFIAANHDDCDEWCLILGDGAIGHDFWLTRNHHGAGFWDRFYGERNRAEIEQGKRLTDAAHAFGEAYLYVGDDGLIYQA